MEMFLDDNVNDWEHLAVKWSPHARLCHTSPCAYNAPSLHQNCSVEQDFVDKSGQQTEAKAPTRSELLSMRTPP